MIGWNRGTGVVATYTLLKITKTANKVFYIFFVFDCEVG